MNVPISIPMNAPPQAGVPQCYDDVCITCSDVALPFRVVELLDDGLAMVDTGDGRTEEISVALVDVAVGDVVLVHAKEAIARVEQSHLDARELDKAQLHATMGSGSAPPAESATESPA